MSEVMGYKIIALGETEKYFLWLFLISNKSAYSLYSYLKETEKGTGRKSMAYVNVRKRVNRLKELGLIEPIKEKHRYRNAIKYRVTSHGLFHCLMMSGTSYTILPLFLERYKDNLILQNILYRFFELKTLEYFDTLPRAAVLGGYLSICCKSILEHIEAFRHSKLKDKEDYMTTENLDQIIMNQVQKFVFDIVNWSNVEKFVIAILNEQNEEYVTLEDPSRDPADPNHAYTFPNLALARDNKFITLLDGIKSNFDKGCENFR